MTRSKSVFACSSCGHNSPKWLGRCVGCGAWNSYQEEQLSRSVGIDRPLTHSTATPLDQVAVAATFSQSTGIGEVDRVLGGGVVAGSVTLVGGEPGIGKSTLLGQVARNRASSGEEVLYVSAEESPQQVSARIHRIGPSPDGLWLAGEPDIGATLGDIERLKPSLVVIDSIQTVFDPNLASAPGSVAQVRHCAHQLARVAKEANLAMVLVGQVTKDGGLAGPRVLEHLVDTVLTFEGDRDFGLRLLRASKHRYGPTGEIGVFEMSGSGLLEVTDPSRLLLSDRRRDVAGSVIAVTTEGQRPLVIEIQSLVTDASAGVARRFAQGIDQAKVAMLLAVLAERGSIRCSNHDVYASVVGGIRLSDPGVDLAMVLAFASAATDTPLDTKTVVIGEVGLAGEVRSVSGLERRLAEAARLGFSRAVVPASEDNDVGRASSPPELEVLSVDTIAEALRRLGIVGSGATEPSLVPGGYLAVVH